MRKLPLIVAAGALTLAGTAFAAANTNLHTMTVKLPDGGVAKIEYTGSVAPKVDIRTGAPGDFAAFEPGFGFSGFQDFAKIEAAMDRQMSDMLREARVMMATPAIPNEPFKANFGAAPGDDSRWFISSGNSGNFCARSVEVTVVNGKRSVRSHTEGNCGPSKGDLSAHQSVVPGKTI